MYSMHSGFTKLLKLFAGNHEASRYLPISRIEVLSDLRDQSDPAVRTRDPTKKWSV